MWAANGVRTVWREEMNFRIEVSVAIVITALGACLRFSWFEWIIIVLCVVSVFSAEMVNTAIEDLCDRVEPAHDPAIGKIKDVMAGFVFTVSLGAVAVGMILFFNHL